MVPESGSPGTPEAGIPEPAPPGYRAGDYPPFAVTVDIVALDPRGAGAARAPHPPGRAPFEGRWALPGGFVHPDESLDEAAARELREETGVDAAAHLEQFGSYGDPDRDPRMRVVSIGYLAVLREVGTLQAGSDATDTALAPVADALGGVDYDLAFDHRRILGDGVSVMREKLERTSLATAFVGPEFTLADLRSVYESAWGQPIDAANFRRKMLSTDGVIRSTGTVRTPSTEGGKPAEVFTAPDDVRELDVRFWSPRSRFALDREVPIGELLERPEVATMREPPAMPSSTDAPARSAVAGTARRTRTERVTTPDLDAIARARSPKGRPHGCATSSAAPVAPRGSSSSGTATGRCSSAAPARRRGEAKPSNRGEADGVRGRLRGIRRQPTASIVRALEQHFPDDAALGVAAVLTNHGECRYVELASGDVVDEVFPVVAARLAEAGILPLAQPDP